MLADDYQKNGLAKSGRHAYKLFRELVDYSNFSEYVELAKRRSGWMVYFRWALGIHSVTDARNALISSMENAITSDRSFLLGEDLYTFEGNGAVREANYHVWQVRRSDDGMHFSNMD